MGVYDLSVRKAKGLVYFVGHEHIGVDAFRRTVKEMHSERKVKPFLFPTGRVPRIPWGGFYTFILDNHGSSDEPLLMGQNRDDSDLKEMLHKCQRGGYKDGNDFVYVVDGDGFDKSTIRALPDYERLYVLFPSYSSKRAVPIEEAKRYLEGKVQTRAASNGIERVNVG